MNNDDERDYAEEKYNAEILRTGDGEAELDIPSLPPRKLNPDYLLGMLRFTRDHLERDVSEIAVASAMILDDDNEMLDDLEDDEGAGMAPADAMYALIDSWFDGE